MTKASRKPKADVPPDVLAGRLRNSMTFSEKVWTLTARIPAGRVVTYRQIAQALHSAACRAVGQALHNNPYAPAVPCHRVVGSDGRLTGYAGGLAVKERMLNSEGVPCKAGRVVDLASRLHQF